MPKQVFSRNIHDPSLPITIQTTSVKLLLNLVDYIFHNDDPDPQRGKKLLQRILKARGLYVFCRRSIQFWFERFIRFVFCWTVLLGCAFVPKWCVKAVFGSVLSIFFWFLFDLMNGEYSANASR